MDYLVRWSLRGRFPLCFNRKTMGSFTENSPVFFITSPYLFPCIIILMISLFVFFLSPTLWEGMKQAPGGHGPYFSDFCWTSNI